MSSKGIGDGDIQGSAPVDVFFVHPTGFLEKKSWTYSMDKKERDRRKHSVDDE